MVNSFDFSHGTNTFTCCIETSRTRAESWWWFSVSGERNGGRYAPFRAGPDDTRDSVQLRVSSFYDEMIHRRSLPPTPHWQRARAATPAPAIVAPIAD